MGGIQSSRGSAVGVSGAGGGTVVKGSGNNVYAGKDGNVYRKDSSGNWSKYEGRGNWGSVDTPSCHTTRPKQAPRVLVSLGNRQLKLRNSGRELGRRLVRPKRDRGEAYLPKPAPNWIERLLPAKVASSEPPSSVNMSAAEAGQAAVAEAEVEAGREVAVAEGVAGAEGEE